MKSASFVREHRTYCGEEFLTVDLFRYTEEQEEAARKPRRRKELVSAPKQRNLNDKRARRYFAQLVNTNFTAEDYHVSLTYREQPDSLTTAEKTVRGWIRKVNYLAKRLELPPVKYIIVTEGGGISQRTGKITRIHHHVILSGGIPREYLELLWNSEPVRWKWLEEGRNYKGRPYREFLRDHMLGFVNADRLQPDSEGLEALSSYLTKDPKGKKRWTASKNLKKPVRITRDRHFSCARFQRACADGDIWSRAWWEQKYRGFTLAGSAESAVEVEAPDEMNDWRVYARLRRIRR